MIRRTKKRVRTNELHPDEILLDSKNLPDFNYQQFEGKIEKAIPQRTIFFFMSFMFLIIGIFFIKLFSLQILNHQFYLDKSEKNSLTTTPIFADRGLIYDRNGVELAWNSLREDDQTEVRKFINQPGFAALLGYVSYPTKDSSGNFWQTRTTGKDGMEKQFDEQLAGTNGSQLVETSVNGKLTVGSMVQTPIQGDNLNLSIDSRLQATLYDSIKNLAGTANFVGGTGVIMDIKTGELRALTSYPEYDPNILSDGQDVATIQGYMTSKARPFLNRAIDGLYTPGSIIKPFMALAGLHEGVITPKTIIVSTGTLKVPNPFNPGKFTIFKDNAVHGAVNVQQAIAVSSNIFFYELGGGYTPTGQKGIGINNIEKYAHMFGIGDKTGVNISGELQGIVPSIGWKAKKFPKDPWRIGDTYNTAIGQYGYQVTPLQMTRAVASIASRGTFVTPTILKTDASQVVASKLPFTDAEYTVVQEAMRMVVTEGTAKILDVPDIHVAAKTGTAQIKNNTRVNSWAIGFFPYEDPKYAFAVLMEDGPKVTSGATHAFRPVLDLISANPDLLK